MGVASYNVIQTECETSKSELDASKAKLTEIQASLEQAKAKQVENLAATNAGQGPETVVPEKEMKAYNGTSTSKTTTTKGSTKTTTNKVSNPSKDLSNTPAPKADILPGGTDSGDGFFQENYTGNSLDGLENHNDLNIQ